MSRGRGMRIGEVADRAGVPAKTIRFWEDRGLLPPPTGYRAYGPAIFERLPFIRHAQAAGLPLGPTGQVLDIRHGGQPRVSTAPASSPGPSPRWTPGSPSRPAPAAH